MSSLTEEEIQSFIDDVIDELPRKELVDWAYGRSAYMDVIYSVVKMSTERFSCESYDINKILLALKERVRLSKV